METPTTLIGWIAAILLGLLNALQMWRYRNQDPNNPTLPNQNPNNIQQTPSQPILPNLSDNGPIENEDNKGVEDKRYQLLLQILEKVHFLEERRQQDAQLIRDILDRKRANAGTLKYLRKSLDDLKESNKKPEVSAPSQMFKGRKR